MNVGLRELRQRASDLVRRAERGEAVTVTVNGRPVALLVPAHRNTWRRAEELVELFSGVDDPTWERDRELLDAVPHDPWARA